MNTESKQNHATEQASGAVAVRRLNRERYIDEYGTQIEPAFDKIDELLCTISQCQNALAEYIVPDSKIADNEIISELLGILDKQSFVRFLNELSA